MPIAAELGFAGPDVPENAKARFDWRGPDDRWDIRIGLEGRLLVVSDGGATLRLDGVPQAVAQGPEYPRVYRRFARLIHTGASEVDGRPLSLVARAFAIAQTQPVAPFLDARFVCTSVGLHSRRRNPKKSGPFHFVPVISVAIAESER